MKHESVMRKSFFVNIVLVIVKIISGLAFQSVALIADGVHSISDLLSDIFVILGIRHSVKPADDEHPFGHGKFEYVLSLFLGLSITFIAYTLGRSVIVNWSDPIQIPAFASLIVIAVVVLSKLVLARYLIRMGELLDSEIVRASGAESFSDVISSAVVFVGVSLAIIGNQTGVDWLLYGDKVASILIAVFIVRIGIGIIYRAIISLQGKSVDKTITKQYLEQIETVPGVQGVDHIDMIAYGPYYQAIVEVEVDGESTVKEGHDVAHQVHDKLMENEKICHVSVHVNPGGSQ